MVWTDRSGLGLGPVKGSCQHGNELKVFHKLQGSS
jgi:hypothetical protein